jgi:hypothetical protein
VEWFSGVTTAPTVCERSSQTSFHEAFALRRVVGNKAPASGNQIKAGNRAIGSRIVSGATIRERADSSATTAITRPVAAHYG